MTSAQLKAARKRLKLSKDQLADKLGLTTRHILRLESGDHPISEVIEIAVNCLVNHGCKHENWDMVSLEGCPDCEYDYEAVHKYYSTHFVSTGLSSQWTAKEQKIFKERGKEPMVLIKKVNHND